MGKLVWIGIGGFIGSVCRYLLSSYVQQIARSTGFPYGTLTVNLVGCFFIGLLAHLVDTRGILSIEVRAFLFIGFLGGFTTFSTFGNETLNLFRSGSNFLALVNIGAQIMLGLSAVWAGRALADLL